MANHTGAMIALVVPDPENYAINPPTENSLTPDDLHITLAYLGEAAEISPEQREAVLDACQVLADTSDAPEVLFPASTGVFPPDPESPEPDPKAAYYAAPATPEKLSPLREDLLVHLSARGVGDLVSTKHPVFTPHVTLTYETLDNPPVLNLPTPVPTTFGTLLVKFGDEAHTFQLGQSEEGPALPLTASVKRSLGSLAARTHHSEEYVTALYLRQRKVRATPAKTRSQAAYTAVVASLVPDAPVTHFPRVQALLDRAELLSSPIKKQALYNRALVLTSKESPADPYAARSLSALTASIQALIADGNSSIARSLRARAQLRDRYGRWIEQGGGVRFKFNGAWVHGRTIGWNNQNGKVYVEQEDGKKVAVPANKIEQPKAIIGLDVPDSTVKGNPFTPKSAGRVGKATSDEETAKIESSKALNDLDAKAFTAIDNIVSQHGDKAAHAKNNKTGGAVTGQHVATLVNDNAQAIRDAKLAGADTVTLTGTKAPFKDQALEVHIDDASAVLDDIDYRAAQNMPAADDAGNMGDEELTKATSTARGKAIAGLGGVWKDRNDEDATALRKAPNVKPEDVDELPDEFNPLDADQSGDVSDQELVDGAQQALDELNNSVSDSHPLADQKNGLASQVQDAISSFKAGDISRDEFGQKMDALKRQSDDLEPEGSQDAGEKAFGAFAEDLDNLHKASGGASVDTADTAEVDGSAPDEEAPEGIDNPDFYNEALSYQASTPEMADAIDSAAGVQGAMYDALTDPDTGNLMDPAAMNPDVQQALEDFTGTMDKFFSTDLPEDKESLQNFSDEFADKAADLSDALHANGIDEEKANAFDAAANEFSQSIVKAASVAKPSGNTGNKDELTYPNVPAPTQKDFFDAGEALHDALGSVEGTPAERKQATALGNKIKNFGKNLQDGKYASHSNEELADGIKSQIIDPLNELANEASKTEHHDLSDAVSEAADHMQGIHDGLIKNGFNADVESTNVPETSPNAPETTSNAPDVESAASAALDAAPAPEMVSQYVPEAVDDYAALDEALKGITDGSDDPVEAVKDALNAANVIQDKLDSHAEDSDSDVQAFVAGETDRLDTLASPLGTFEEAQDSETDAPIDTSLHDSIIEGLKQNGSGPAMFLADYYQTLKDNNQPLSESDIAAVSNMVDVMQVAPDTTPDDKADLGATKDILDSVKNDTTPSAPSTPEAPETPAPTTEEEEGLADWEKELLGIPLDGDSTPEVPATEDPETPEAVVESGEKLADDDLSGALNAWDETLSDFSSKYSPEEFAGSAFSPNAWNSLSKSQKADLTQIAGTLSPDSSDKLTQALAEHEAKKLTDGQLLAAVSDVLMSDSTLTLKSADKLKTWQGGVQMNTKNSAPALTPTQAAYSDEALTADSLWVMHPAQMAGTLATLDLQKNNKAQQTLENLAATDGDMATVMAHLSDASAAEKSANNSLFSGDRAALTSDLRDALDAYDLAIAKYKSKYKSKTDISTNLDARRRAVDEMLAGLEGRKADALKTGIVATNHSAIDLNPETHHQNKFGEDVYSGDLVESQYGDAKGKVGFFLGFQQALVGGKLKVRGPVKYPEDKDPQQNTSIMHQKLFAVGPNNPLYHDDAAREALGIKKVDELTDADSLYSFGNYDYAEALQKYLDAPNAKNIDPTGVENVFLPDGTPVSISEAKLKKLEDAAGKAPKSALPEITVDPEELASDINSAPSESALDSIKDTIKSQYANGSLTYAQYKSLMALVKDKKKGFGEGDNGGGGTEPTAPEPTAPSAPAAEVSPEVGHDYATDDEATVAATLDALPEGSTLAMKFQFSFSDQDIIMTKQADGTWESADVEGVSSAQIAKQVGQNDFKKVVLQSDGPASEDATPEEPSILPDGYKAPPAGSKILYKSSPNAISDGYTESGTGKSDYAVKEPDGTLRLYAADGFTTEFNDYIQQNNDSLDSHPNWVPAEIPNDEGLADWEKEILGLEAEKNAATPTPDAPAATSSGEVKTYDISDWKAESKHLGGSTGAKLYTAPDGSQYVVKPAAGNNYGMSAEELQHNASIEVLASVMYNSLGEKAPEIGLTTLPDGTVGVVSPLVNGFTPFHSLTSDQKTKVKKYMYDNYALDTWLSNYDVIGAGMGDNFGLDADGNVVHLDNGGTFDVKAQGGKKVWWGDDAVDFDTWSSGVAPSGSSAWYSTIDFYNGISNAEKIESAKKLQTITDQNIADMVNKVPTLTDAEKTKLTNTLIKRRDSILAKAGLDKVAPTTAKVPGDPTLPKLGDKVSYVQGNGVKKSGTVIGFMPDGTMKVKSDVAVDKNGNPAIHKVGADNVSKWTNETAAAAPVSAKPNGEPLTTANDFVVQQEADPSSPWYGEDKKPKLPTADVTDVVGNWIDDDLFAQLEQRYQDFKKSKGETPGSLKESGDWNNYLGAIIEQGSLSHLETLHNKGRIDDDLYAKVKTSLEEKHKANAGSILDFQQNQEKYNQELIAWSLANGYPVLRLPSDAQMSNVPKETTDKAVSWWKKHLQGITFTPEEKNGIYQQKDTSSWQSVIRALAKSNSLNKDELRAKLSPSNKAIFDGISSAALKGKIPDGELGAFMVREISPQSFHDITGAPLSHNADIKQLVGSTQFDFGAAEGSVGNHQAGAVSLYPQGNIRLNMHLLPGVEATYAPLSGGTNNSSEKGAILSPGSAYYVKDAYLSSDGKWTLEVAVIPQSLYSKFGYFSGEGYDIPVVKGDMPDLNSIKPEVGNAVVTKPSDQPFDGTSKVSTDEDGITGN